jgi:hypothetical protein
MANGATCPPSCSKCARISLGADGCSNNGRGVRPCFSRQGLKDDRSRSARGAPIGRSRNPARFIVWRGCAPALARRSCSTDFPFGHLPAPRYSRLAPHGHRNRPDAPAALPCPDGPCLSRGDRPGAGPAARAAGACRRQPQRSPDRRRRRVDRPAQPRPCDLVRRLVGGDEQVGRRTCSSPPTSSGWTISPARV